jgi:hypothetical protein
MLLEEYTDKIKMLMQLYYSRLSEKDRRQYAAMEALRLGRGGTTYISKVLGVDRNTIIQGKKELVELTGYQQIPPGRQRRAGGGRKKKDARPEY